MKEISEAAKIDSLDVATATEWSNAIAKRFHDETGWIAPGQRNSYDNCESDERNHRWNGWLFKLNRFYINALTAIDSAHPVAKDVEELVKHLENAFRGINPSGEMGYDGAVGLEVWTSKDGRKAMKQVLTAFLTSREEAAKEEIGRLREECERYRSGLSSRDIEIKRLRRELN